MSYDLTNISNNVTNIANLAVQANNASNGLLGIGILIVFFFVLITSISYNRYDIKSVFLISGFLTTILALLFTIVGMVSPDVFIICLFFTAGAILWKWITAG